METTQQSKIEEIIKKAVEGGWINLGNSSITKIDCENAQLTGKFHIHIFDMESDIFSYNLFEMFCDKCFWQALFPDNTKKGDVYVPDFKNLEFERGKRWIFESLLFDKLNLTESFSAAIDYLFNLITK